MLIKAAPNDFTHQTSTTQKLTLAAIQPPPKTPNSHRNGPGSNKSTTQTHDLQQQKKQSRTKERLKSNRTQEKRPSQKCKDRKETLRRPNSNDRTNPRRQSRTSRIIKRRKEEQGFEGFEGEEGEGWGG